MPYPTGSVTFVYKMGAFTPKAVPQGPSFTRVYVYLNRNQTQRGEIEGSILFFRRRVLSFRYGCIIAEINMIH